MLLRRLDALMRSARRPGRDHFRRRRQPRLPARIVLRREGARRSALSATSGCRAISATRSRSPPASSAPRGDAVVVIDADLQDPPELVLEMLAKWREGYDVVYGRAPSRDGESRFKRCDGAPVLPHAQPAVGGRDPARYRRLPADRPQGGRRVPRHARARPLRARHVRLARLPPGRGDVSPAPRLAGETKYPFWKMIRLAVNGASAFPTCRCGLAIWAGFAVSVLSPRSRLLRSSCAGSRRPASRRRLGLDHCHRLVPLRRQHDDDRNHGPLCRTHLRRGEAAAALRDPQRVGFIETADEMRPHSKAG